jgi:hypothetical protein
MPATSIFIHQTLDNLIHGVRRLLLLYDRPDITSNGSGVGIRPYEQETRAQAAAEASEAQSGAEAEANVEVEVQMQAGVEDRLTVAARAYEAGACTRPLFSST